MKRKFAVLIMMAALAVTGCGNQSAGNEVAENVAEKEAASEESQAEVTDPFEVDLKSFESIIASLPEGYFYAFADMDAKNDALLVTDYTFDDGEGNLLTTEAEVYGFDKDNKIIKYGTLSSGGTAYPFAVNEGCVYYGGNHNINKAYIDEDGSSLIISESASETFDTDGNATYYYTSAEDGKETVVEDDSMLTKLYDEYDKAVEICFFPAGETSEE